MVEMCPSALHPARLLLCPRVKGIKAVPIEGIRTVPTDERQRLWRYAPLYVCRYFREHKSGGQPIAHTFEGATLVADIVGFSQLTEQLGKQGARGAEEVSILLDRYFGCLTEIVLDTGGDVATFTGDGLIGLWWGDADAGVWAAARCGLAMQEALAALNQTAPAVIHQRVSIACGELVHLRLGGSGGLCFHLLGGPGVDMAGAANAHGAAGEVIVTPAAAVLLSDRANLLLVDNQYALLRAVAARATPAPASPSVPAASDDLVARYLPPWAADRLRGGHAEWLGEFRDLTVLFAGMSAPKRFDSESLERLDRYVGGVQRTFADLGGFIDGIVIDEKGLVVRGLFGLPPAGLQDAAVRAVQAACALVEMCSAESSLGVGVTTGRLFFGEYGGPRRRTFSPVGPEVNLAARLMQAARDGVLCDLRTMQRAASKIGFEDAGTLRVKRATHEIHVMRPAAGPGGLTRAPSRRAVGRSGELGRLAGRLDALRRGHGGAALLRGPPGIGKSLLLDEVASEARGRDLAVVGVVMSLLDRRDPFASFGRLIEALLLGDGGGSRAALQEAVLDRLSLDPELMPFAPLLNDVLKLDLPETALTREIVGDARRATVERLLLHLAGDALGPRSTVLTIDDFQLMDSASSALLDRVLDALPGHLLVAAARDGGGDDSVAPERLAARQGVLVLGLGPLTPAAIAAQLKQFLSVDVVGAELLAFIEGRAGGHPLHTEELTRTLRDAGLLEVANGVARIWPEAPKELLETVPDSLRELIIGRFDQLEMRAQMVLRVLSVVAATTSERLLRSVPSLRRYASEMGPVLEMLAHHEFLRIGDDVAGRTATFRHDVLRTVIYDQMLFAQRRRVHREVAEWLEQAHAVDQETAAARLAMHWEAAEEYARAVDNLERIAVRSLRLYAPADAIRHVQHAFELVDRHGLDVDARRRSRWHSLLADGHQELFDYDEAARHFSEVLSLVARPAPASTLEQVCRTALSAGTQALLRARRAPLLGPPLPASDLCGLAAHAHERLAEIAYFDNRSLAVLHHTLASLNLAEKAASVREIVDGFAALSIGLGTVGLRRLAAFYNRRSLDVAAVHGSLADVAYARLVDMVYNAGLGRWAAVEASAEIASSLFLRLGGRMRWQQTRATLCFATFTRGRMEESAAILADFEQTLDQGSPAQIRAWALCARLVLELAGDRPQPATLTSAAAVVGDPKLHEAERLLCEGLLAIGHARRGDTEAASTWATAGLKRLQRQPPAAWHLSEGIAGIAETLIAAAGQTSASARRERNSPVSVAALAASAAFLRYAKRIPVAEPRAAIVAARFALLAGRRRRARRWLRRATAAAVRLQTRREQDVATALQAALNSPLEA
jgi:class 3 adenylate cyclase